VEIRQAHADGWEELRKLRLRALTDAPDAFSSTLEQEAAYPAEVWQRWAEGGPTSADFIAREGGASIGMAAIYRIRSGIRRCWGLAGSAQTKATADRQQFDCARGRLPIDRSVSLKHRPSTRVPLAVSLVSLYGGFSRCDVTR